MSRELVAHNKPVFDQLHPRVYAGVIALVVWSTLSVLWTPYPVSALQEVLKLALLIEATLLTVAAPRDKARATDLYLFPIGVVLLMFAMAAKGLSNMLSGAMDDGGLQAGGVALAVLLFPALGGITARGRALKCPWPRSNGCAKRIGGRALSSICSLSVSVLSNAIRAVFKAGG